MRQWLTWFAVAICSSQLVSAQSETALWQYFEGRTAVAKVDLPATSTGVDIYPDSSLASNEAQYGKQLKQFGTGTRRNEPVTITDLKVMPKSIEIELGGSDAGSADSSQVYVAAAKSPRERSLERDLERETDPARKERMQKELEDLRAQRAREDERLKSTLAQLTRSQDSTRTPRASYTGSRFNLVFPAGVPSRALTPEYVIIALKPWISFDGDRGSAIPESSAPVSRDQATRAVAESSGSEEQSARELRKGLTEPELKRLLGDPVKREPYIEGDLHVEILTFKKNETMVEATMVEGVLVRFREWSD